MSTHPPDTNPQAPSGSLRFRRLDIPTRLVIPCHGCGEQDLASLKPPGTLIRRGKALLEERSKDCLALFAPVDARIAGLRSVMVTCPDEVPGIVLEPILPAQPTDADGQNASATPDSVPDLHGIGPAHVAGRLAELGVWADRWASPDLLAQLRAPHRKPVDTILCNILDEDPTVPLQAHVAAERSADVVAGILALAAATGAAKLLAVVAYDAPAEAWENLQAASAKTKLRLVPLRNEYPQAHPTLVAREVTGRRLRPGQLPVDQSIVILDAVAAAAAGRALTLGEPMIEAPFAIHDYLARRTHFVWAPIGMAVADILEQLRIPARDIELRAGCPLREVRMTPQCVVGGAELTVAVVPAEAKTAIEPCIRCAWCVEGCPVRIQPAGLLDAAQQDDLYLAGQYGLDACIECGICSYVCPSHLPLLGAVHVLREMQLGSRRGRKA